MNLFKNLDFLGGKNLDVKEKGTKVLFSGFLIAFLGASGVQTNMSLDLPSPEKPEEKTASVCPAAPSTLATLEIANGASSQDQGSPECQKEKNIERTIKEKTALPKENGGDTQAIAELKKEQEAKHQEKVAKLEKLLEGYPLQKMAGEIAKQEPEIAALIVGIARKESQWGLRSPKKNGDCFNYWGFKGKGGRGVGMGHACFATREEAVEKIANRLEKLVAKRGTSKPSALVTTWKCGQSCAGHSKESVQKWVSDVNQYYSKVLALK